MSRIGVNSHWSVDIFRSDYFIKNLQLIQIISSFIMTARPSTASSGAMSDSFSVNLITQNSSDPDSSRSGSEIFIDVETFFCNDIDLDKTDHHILNKSVTYRVSQYAVFGIENYDLWICIQTDFVLFIENHLRQLNESTWKMLLDYCYSHEYWLDHDSKRKMSDNFMKTISFDAEYSNK